MFVLINLEDLSVVAKNESYTQLSTLALIECAVDPSHVLPLDSLDDLKCFSTLELISLYRNLTGHSFTESDGRDLIKHNLFQALHTAPVTKLNSERLNKQADRVPSDADCNFIYVEGSSVPQPAINGDGLLCLQGSHIAGLKHHSVPQVKRTTCKADQATRERSNTVKTSGTVRRGSNKETIWTVADTMWEAAGKPTDKGTILQLRKQIMDVLEADYDVKRTSASSSLGEWHKERAPF